MSTQQKSLPKLARNLFFAVLLGLLAYNAFGWMTNVKTQSAFVNAPVYSLRSPIEGTLSYQIALQVGDAVRKGQVVAQVDNNAVHDVLAMKQDIEMKLQNARAQVALLRATLAERQGMYSDFDRRDGMQNAMRVSYTSKELQQAQAGYEEAMKGVRNSQARNERYQALAQKGYVSGLQAQAESNALALAMERANAKKSELEAVALEHRASRSGLQLAGAQTESSPRLQKQVLSKEMLDIRQSLAQYQSSIPLLQSQLAAMNKELSVMSGARIASPVDGTVWAAPVRDGEVVERHDVVYKVVNCNDSWVDAYLNESEASRIDTAKPVRVRVGKAATEYLGKIKFVRTGVGKFSLDEGAPEGFDQIVKNKSLVRISVQWPKAQAGTCSVGQTAEVSFNAP